MRFRVDLPLRIPGARLIRPDIVFTAVRLAVFIDGCFWHCCPLHGQRPALQNGHYWGPKLAGNVERDGRHAELLTLAGWTVLRFWEHEDADDVATHVQATWRSLHGATARDR